jgi:Ca2+-binding EF-hand superfamily protein
LYWKSVSIWHERSQGLQTCNIIGIHSLFNSESFLYILQVIAESLSEEEIGGLKELFKMIDTDGSGTITFDELKEGLKRVGSELTEHEIQALMDAVRI